MFVIFGRKPSVVVCRWFPLSATLNSAATVRIYRKHAQNGYISRHRRWILTIFGRKPSDMVCRSNVSCLLTNVLRLSTYGLKTLVLYTKRRGFVTLSGAVLSIGATDFGDLCVGRLAIFRSLAISKERPGIRRPPFVIT